MNSNSLRKNSISPRLKRSRLRNRSVMSTACPIYLSRTNKCYSNSNGSKKTENNIEMPIFLTFNSCNLHRCKKPLHLNLTMAIIIWCRKIKSSWMIRRDLTRRCGPKVWWRSAIHRCKWDGIGNHQLTRTIHFEIRATKIIRNSSQNWKKNTRITILPSHFKGI